MGWGEKKIGRILLFFYISALLSKSPYWLVHYVYFISMFTCFFLFFFCAVYSRVFGVECFNDLGGGAYVVLLMLRVERRVERRAAGSGQKGRCRWAWQLPLNLTRVCACLAPPPRLPGSGCARSPPGRPASRHAAHRVPLAWFLFSEVWRQGDNWPGLGSSPHSLLSRCFSSPRNHFLFIAAARGLMLS